MRDRQSKKSIWIAIILIFIVQTFLFVKLNKVEKFYSDAIQNPMLAPPEATASGNDVAINEVVSSVRTMNTLVGDILTIMRQVQELNENPELKARMKEAAELYQSINKEDLEDSEIDKKSLIKARLLQKKQAKEKKSVVDEAFEERGKIKKPNKKDKPLFIQKEKPVAPVAKEKPLEKVAVPVVPAAPPVTDPASAEHQ